MGSNIIMEIRSPDKNDLTQMKEVFASTGFFHDFELEIVNGMMDELVTDVPYVPEPDGITTRVAVVNGRVVGVTMFGADVMSKRSWDLYWIATHKDAEGKGVGLCLMADMEKTIAMRGPLQIVFAETSSRNLYLPTREFYLRNGYTLEATIKDYYDLGDGKCIFSKRLG